MYIQGFFYLNLDTDLINIILHLYPYLDASGNSFLNTLQ